MNVKFTQELLENRRSVYPELYTEETISQEDLSALLAVANCAPTHKLTEPWRFRVLKEQKEALGILLVNWYKENTLPENFKETKVKRIQKRVAKSAYMVAIVMQRDPEKRIPEWEELAATAMAVQNIWLMGTAMGIGMYWSSPKAIASDEMATFLQLEKGEQCLGFLYMGRYLKDINLEAKHQPISTKIKWM